VPQRKAGKRRRDPDVELKTQFIYGLLTRHRIGYDRATRIANVLLDKDMRDETWRKYISRWAERNGLEKPDLRRKEE
jgi:hypothetical protein